MTRLAAAIVLLSAVALPRQTSPPSHSPQSDVAQAFPPSFATRNLREFRRGLADQPPPRLRRSAEASAKAEAQSAQAERPASSGTASIDGRVVASPGETPLR